MTKNRATLIGFSAVLLWAALAFFTVGSAPVPPLLLNAICFAIGGALGIVWTAASGDIRALKQVPLRVYLFGIIGLFGYHALYFTALRLSPAAEAGLIAYLWPLLIVLFSSLLPGERLRAGHAAGALLGFVGAAVIILGKGAAGFSLAFLPGYGLALCCALAWSAYSVGSRFVGAAPTSSVAVFCIGASVLSAVLHVALEETIWPVSTMGWLSVAALGLGPVGLAFYTWDIGVKHGEIQLLGTSAYAAPLLSTLLLVVTGTAEPSWGLAAAAVLITAGAVLAARASMRARKSG